MKSLSKVTNPKKDILSSTFNLKESTTVPLSSVPASNLKESTFQSEEDASDSSPEQTERDDYDASEVPYQVGNPFWKKNWKMDSYNLATSEDRIRRPNETKQKDLPKFESKNSHSDYYLSTLLQVK